MSTRTTTYTETEYFDQDLMVQVRRLMCASFTGEITLRTNQGRVYAVVATEKKINVDIQESLGAHSQPKLAVART